MDPCSKPARRIARSGAAWPVNNTTGISPAPHILEIQYVGAMVHAKMARSGVAAQTSSFCASKPYPANTKYRPSNAPPHTTGAASPAAKSRIRVASTRPRFWYAREREVAGVGALPLGDRMLCRAAS